MDFWRNGVWICLHFCHVYYKLQIFLLVALSFAFIFCFSFCPDSICPFYCLVTSYFWAISSGVLSLSYLQLDLQMFLAYSYTSLCLPNSHCYILLLNFLSLFPNRYIFIYFCMNFSPSSICLYFWQPRTLRYYTSCLLILIWISCFSILIFILDYYAQLYYISDLFCCTKLVEWLSFQFHQHSSDIFLSPSRYCLFFPISCGVN